MEGSTLPLLVGGFNGSNWVVRYRYQSCVFSACLVCVEFCEMQRNLVFQLYCPVRVPKVPVIMSPSSFSFDLNFECHIRYQYCTECRSQDIGSGELGPQGKAENRSIAVFKHVIAVVKHMVASF